MLADEKKLRRHIYHLIPGRQKFVRLDPYLPMGFGLDQSNVAIENFSLIVAPLSKISLKQVQW
jgi:hypothetical protein